MTTMRDMNELAVRRCRRSKGTPCRVLVLALGPLMLCLGACKGTDEEPARDGLVGDQSSQPDQTPWPDLGVPQVCEASCQAQDVLLCAEYNAGPGPLCVPCTTDAHCQGNPAALGPKCDQQQCTCTTDADCATSYRGNKCSQGVCTCSTSADCRPPFTTCALWYVSDPTSGQVASWHCFKHEPCATDSDCRIGDPHDSNPKDPLRYCDPARGACVACRENRHCLSGYSNGAEVCDVGTGACRGCQNDADCADSPRGTVCDGDGYCGCASDADCSEAYLWGNKCIPIPETTLKRCGCDSAADCAGNGHGPVCDYGHCHCNGDSECTVAPYTKCYPHFFYAITHCQEPCTQDSDCADWMYAESGKCVDGKC